MRIFVTGSNGLIGAVVVRRPVDGGHGAVCLLRPMRHMSTTAPGARTVMP